MHIPALNYVASALSLSPGFQKPLTPGSSESLAAAIPTTKVPGGSPLSLCPASSPTDLFNITSVQLSQQPIFIGDAFLFHIYGDFRATFGANATLTATLNCGSHCDDYGVPESNRPGESTAEDFCELSEIEQPSGGKKKEVTCPPEPGHALITSPGYVVPLFFHWPAWYNFTFDAKTAEGERIYCLTAEVCLNYRPEDKHKHYTGPHGPWTNCTWPY